MAALAKDPFPFFLYLFYSLYYTLDMDQSDSMGMGMEDNRTVLQVYELACKCSQR